MQTITIITLFDITNTEIVRNYKPVLVDTHPTITSEQEWIKSRKQQMNYETLIQILSLRGQPMPISKPHIIKSKNKKAWTFSFEVEHNSVYANLTDKLGLLKEDIEKVPMVIHLDEDISDKYLQVNKNIWLKIKDVL